jgi:hypothetical protein
VKHPVNERRKYWAFAATAAGFAVFCKIFIQRGFDPPIRDLVRRTHWIVDKEALNKHEWRDLVRKKWVILAVTYIFLTSGTSTTLPNDFNPVNNNIFAIGAGGGGQNGGALSTYSGGAGGNGGNFAEIANFNGLPTQVVGYQVGAGDTIWNNSCTLVAKANANGSGNVGTIIFGGGAGGAAGAWSGAANEGAGGGGGGGAASYSGGGVSGAPGISDNPSGCVTPRAGGNGGQGGAGSGGPGGLGGITNCMKDGSNGSNGFEIDGVAGSGGGGGGGAGGLNTFPAGNAGNAGFYGGGGGGGGGYSPVGIGGSASQGLLAFSYTPGGGYSYSQILG